MAVVEPTPSLLTGLTQHGKDQSLHRPNATTCYISLVVGKHAVCTVHIQVFYKRYHHMRPHESVEAVRLWLDCASGALDFKEGVFYS